MSTTTRTCAPIPVTADEHSVSGKDFPLHAVVEHKGGEFMGIVVRRFPNQLHVLVGRTVTHFGQYGNTYEDVEYGARPDDVRWTGQIIRPVLEAVA